MGYNLDWAENTSQRQQTANYGGSTGDFSPDGGKLFGLPVAFWALAGGAVLVLFLLRRRQ